MPPKFKKSKKGARVGVSRNKKIRMARPMARARPGRGIAALDQAAADYANLIMDPCNAKLTNTIWPGSNGALVSRFECDFLAYTQATETAGSFAFCPRTGQFYTNTTLMTTDAIASTLGFGSTAQCPGAAFLANQASSIRPVAACIQISFPGTELNRQGIIGLGLARGETVYDYVSTAAGGLNGTVTAGQIRTLCQHTERTPNEIAEIIWQPGPGDTLDTVAGVGVTAVTPNLIGANVLFGCAAGLPVSTGIRIRIVYVVEWTPLGGSGMISKVEAPRSHNTLNDVLLAIPRIAGDDGWFINTYKKIRPYARAIGSAINYGAKMLGPAMMAL